MDDAACLRSLVFRSVLSASREKTRQCTKRSCAVHRVGCTLKNYSYNSVVRTYTHSKERERKQGASLAVGGHRTGHNACLLFGKDGYGTENGDFVLTESHTTACLIVRSWFTRARPQNLILRFDIYFFFCHKMSLNAYILYAV